MPQWLALTIAVALVGGLIGHRLKLPTGALLGSMVFVVTFNLITEKGAFHPDIRVGIQILCGVMIGSRISKKDILELRQILLPAVIMLVSMVFLNLSFGTAMYRLSSFDIATSLFASAPGGVMDMAMISEDLGANPAYVALMQLFRILIILSCCPVLYRKVILAYREKKGILLNSAPAPQVAADAVQVVSDDIGTSVKPVQSGLMSRNTRRLLILIVLGLIGGLSFYHLRITAGALLGSMILCTVFCIFRGTVNFPGTLRIVMQSLAGAYIGVQLDRQNIAQIQDLVVPILIMFVGIFVFVVIVSFVMHRLTGLSIDVCLLSSTPGGLSEMALLSEDLGSDTPKIAVMQVVRMFTVVLTFPTMLKFVTGLSA